MRSHIIIKAAIIYLKQHFIEDKPPHIDIRIDEQPQKPEVILMCASTIHALAPYYSTKYYIHINMNDAVPR